MDEVQTTVGSSSDKRAEKEKELGLTDYDFAGAAGPRNKRAGPLEAHLFIIDALVSKPAELAVETTLAEQIWRGVIALSTFAKAVCLRVLHWWNPRMELSHLQRMELIQHHLAAYGSLREEYRNTCELMSSVHLASSPHAQALQDERSDPHSHSGINTHGRALLAMQCFVCCGGLAAV